MDRTGNEDVPPSDRPRPAGCDIQDVHQRLADLVLIGRVDEVVDLGAGKGRTLIEVARRSPRSQLTAVDLADEALAELSAKLPRTRILHHDLAEPLPIADHRTDVVLSYNTLECLQDPAAALTEVARVLRPNGRAVIGHTDFETIVVAADDRDLTRRVLLTYAELPVLYRHMAAADAQMGRRLPGLVRRSPLHLETVHAHTTVLSSFPEAWTARLAEVVASVRRSAGLKLGYVTVTEVEEWTQQLHASDASGDFLFSETAYLVTAQSTQ